MNYNEEKLEDCFKLIGLNTLSEYKDHRLSKLVLKVSKHIKINSNKNTIWPQLTITPWIQQTNNLKLILLLFLFI